MPLLLLTRLTSVEIVFTKAFARGLPVTNLALTGLPGTRGGGVVSGTRTRIGAGLLVLISSSAFMASLAILASARAIRRATPAHRHSLDLRLAARTTGLDDYAHHDRVALGHLLAELKRACTLVALRVRFL